jgi:probable HAF family extracellular repeat protein
MDINEHGQVVGTNWDAEGARAFLWQDGLMIDLGSLGGRPFSEAWGINGKGQVVGSSRDTFGGIESSRGFLWQDGVMTDLGTLGGGWSYATDINDQSQVVGYGGTATGEWYSFLWQNGQMTDLGGPTGPQMLAAAINERGQVVGTMFVPTGQHAFLWENGRTIDLGALDGRYSIAFDINERGQVVGETGLPSTPTYGSEIDGFIWEGGVMAALGGGPYGRPYYTHAWGINNRGQIAGDANSGALLWSPSHSSSAAAAIDTRGHGGESTINARSFGWTDAAPARLIRVLSPSGRAPLEFGIRGLPAGSYSARIFDVQGRLVRRWEGFSGDASTRDTWDGRAEDGSRAGTGMYLLRVDAGGRTLSAKLLLVR